MPIKDFRSKRRIPTHLKHCNNLRRLAKKSRHDLSMAAGKSTPDKLQPTPPAPQPALPALQLVPPALLLAPPTLQLAPQPAPLASFSADTASLADLLPKPIAANTDTKAGLASTQPSNKYSADVISKNNVLVIGTNDTSWIKQETPVAEIDKVMVPCKCRLCLREITTHATPIWGDSGIYEKVIRCSAVTVHETDIFQFVCRYCNKYLDYIDNFQQICLKSNEIFLTLNFLKEEDPFQDSLNHEEIIIEPLIEDKYKLEEMYSYGGEEPIATTTNFDSEDEIMLEYPCTECPMISFQEEDYLIHQKSHKVRAKRLARIELCPICGKIIKNMPFAMHMRPHTHPPRPTECDECGKKLSGPDALRQHKQRHQNKVLRDCTLCGSKFTSNSTLKNHMDNVHNQKPLSSCPYCDRKFNCPYNMRVHMRTHTGEVPYSCPDCGISFAHRVTMKLHRLKEHKVNMFDPPTQKDGLKRKRIRTNKKGNVGPSQDA